MRPLSATMILTLMGVSAAAQQQTAAQQPIPPANITPRLDLSLGYEHFQANAPPGVSGNFGFNGGFAGVDFHVKPWLALTAEINGGHANNISSLGQNLTLLTYMAGPRIQYGHHRVVPFLEGLVGGAHGGDSFFPSGSTYSTSANSLAYAAGGGLDLNLTHRIAIRPVEALYLHTSLPNGSTNVQHHLLTGAGIVIKFGGRAPLPPAPPPAEAIVTRPQGDIHFTCALNILQAAPGQPIRILGETSTEPDHLNVMYTWMPDAGMIEGTGREVVLNTTGLPAGHYHLRGHAAVTGDYALAADCNLPFEITAPVAVIVAPPPPPPPPPVAEQEFHSNVPDAYFDYNNAALRPDAHAATLHAADFLNSHPQIRVRVEGFADERGSVEYNLMLGQQRAEAARNALIGAGVDAARVEIISFGKADPVCQEKNESCFRQNRRAAFSLHP